MKNRYLVFQILSLCCLICVQSCTVYYIQNDTTKLQSIKIRYNDDINRTKRNELTLLSAEKKGEIVELRKNTEGKEQVSFDFKLPPNAKLPLNKLLSSTYFDTASYSVICYPSKIADGVDSVSCLRFDQLSSNTKRSGVPLFLVRTTKKILIK